MNSGIKDDLLHICDHILKFVNISHENVLDDLHKLKGVLQKVHDDKHELYKIKNPVLKKETPSTYVFDGIKSAIHNIQQTIVLDTKGVCHKEPKLLCNLAKDLIVKIDMYIELIKIQEKEGISI